MLTIVAEDYTWNGTGTSWGDADAWTKGGAAATWSDGNNAIFASGTAVLVADASASDLRFTGDAAIEADASTDTPAVLTVPKVNVTEGVTATVSAGLSSGIEKTGLGTLVLSASREEKTTRVTEGTVKLTGGVAIGDLTLGTDAAKPVAFDYDGETLTASPTTYLGAGMDVTLTNGTFAATSAQALTQDNSPATLTIAANATVSTTGRFSFNPFADTDEMTVNVQGGVLKTTGSASSTAGNNYMMNRGAGKFALNVTDGGRIEITGCVYALTGHEYEALAANANPRFDWTFNDSSMYIGGNGLAFGWYGSKRTIGKVPAKPEGRLAVTNSNISTAAALTIGEETSRYNTADNTLEGFYAVDFENSVLTSMCVTVHSDRKNSLRFNNSTLVLPEDNTDWLVSDGDFESKWNDHPATVGAGGFTLDTQSYRGALKADLGGEGAVTKIGSGKLTVAESQTSSGALSCEVGETFINGGLTVNRPATVKDGATLTVKADALSTFASLTLESGAILNIDTYTVGVTPFAASALALPASGTVTLRLNGSTFPIGRYAILEKTGITAADVEGKLDPSVSAGSASWEVSGDTLYLVVKGANDFIWTGAGSDAKFSNGANWQGGSRPESGANVIIALGTAGTIERCLTSTSMRTARM